MSAWVLLRGLTREARHWGDFPRRLQAAFPGARIAALDLPGCGRHCAGESPLDIAAIADHVRSQAPLDAGPVRVLGLSLGAMVAIDWARRFPEELAGIALVNTSVRPFSAFHRRLLPRNYPALARLVLRPGSAGAREAAILRLTSTRGDPDGSTLAQWQRIGESAPVTRANAARQLWAAARFEAPRSAPDVPVLVLASGGDGFVDPGCSRSLAEAWGAPFVLHRDGGHDLPLDAPDWVIFQLAGWAARPGRR